MEKGNFKSFEEAQATVQGTRTMLVMKFKPFLETGFGINDLFAVADEGIYRAWKEWNPDVSKYNSFAYNHMNWALNDFMNEMNSRFKVNAITTYELTREGESFKEIKAVGKTKNEDFNTSYCEDYILDGSDEAKSRINRDVFNAYVAFETAIRRPFYMISASQFQSDETEDFDIIDSAVDTTDSNEFNWEGFSIPRVEMEETMTHLEEDKKRVAQMILENVSVGDMAKEFGLTQVQFMQRFAGENPTMKNKSQRTKVKSKKASQATLDFLAQQREKKAKRAAATA